MNEDAFTFLALGDSYTVGEAVSEKERWSVQLVVRLREDGVAIGKSSNNSYHWMDNGRIDIQHRKSGCKEIIQYCIVAYRSE